MKPNIMGARTSYEDRHILLEHLAKKLKRGSLAIVLGAGASAAFKLPQWTALLEKMFSDAKLSRPANLNDELAAEHYLQKVTPGDRMLFAQHVRTALYHGTDLGFDALRRNDLLAAIGALSMGSGRGSVSTIVTFNFDDIVEVFLSYYGYHVNTVASLPAWTERADVKVLHPHGLLPSNFDRAIPRPIVFTASDYDDVVGNAKDEWHNAILETMRSHTCLFVGLSGNDGNLRSLLKKANDMHAKHETGELYWGVRFGLAGDHLRDMWQERGVFGVEVLEHSDIPQLLFQICQYAAKLA